MLSSDQSVYSDNRVKPWLLRITIGDEQTALEEKNLN